jgi:uncharacterized protein YjlB
VNAECEVLLTPLNYTGEDRLSTTAEKERKGDKDILPQGERPSPYKKGKGKKIQQKKMSFRPASEIRISRHAIPAWHRIPNTSIQNKPLLIYHSAFNASASQLSARLEEIGAVVPQWQYTMYRQTHFHSNTHEVLGVISGRARLCFGGEENPGRVEPTVEQGDLMIVPAGVSHRLLEDLSGGSFKMLGAYPPGKSWDMNYGKESESEEEVKKNIASQAWFDRDPLYGKDGPALHI